jgi:uncharacterized protein
VGASRSQSAGSSYPTVPAEVFDGDARVAALAIERANTWWSRFVGLMGRRGLPEATGLLIEPCSSVHTSFMRFPIDVVYLDHERRVVKVVDRLKPWRVSMGGRRARYTLELTGGEAERLGIVPGTDLRLAE